MAMSTDDISPQAQIQEMVRGFWKTRAIQTAVRLGLPDLMASGPRPAAEIAAQANCNADAVHRLLRALVSIGICADAGEGRFGVTPLGETLRSDVPGSMRGVVLHFGEMMCDLWAHLAECVRSGSSARKLSGAGDDFSFLAANPEVAAVFNSAMAQMTRQIAAAVIAVYDFSGIEKLMDVGGGYGQLLATILQANPAMRGILFDMGHAADGARRELAAAGVGGRCEVAVGDFFKEVPAGADAYILKSIIHDWDDERSIRILRNCRRAAEKGARVLLVERVVPERMQVAPEDQLTAMLDLNMLVGPGGRERTESEYRKLFGAAGLRLTRIVPTRSGSSVIEAQPA
jgi:orsellinic acid C2-O-methyltransferase